MSEEKIHFIKKPSYARIGKNKVVQLKCLIQDAQGEVLEFREDLLYLHGGYGGAFPVVEAALEGHEVGAKVKVPVSPEEGFGMRRPELLIEVPASELPAEALTPGTFLEAEDEQGQPVRFQVIAIEQDKVRLDGNHPYADKALKFLLEVLEIRDASQEELEKGYALRHPQTAP
jgi:FKBP-type peptidyl-prolyl cis-trans isomerase SlyD